MHGQQNVKKKKGKKPSARAKKKEWKTQQGK